MHVIEVRNAELFETLAREAKQLGVLNAAIVTLIGAADAFTISSMPRDDATKRDVTDYDQPAEMVATGEIVDGAVHIHAVMGVEGHRAVAGHLYQATIGTWFARAYIQPS